MTPLDTWLICGQRVDEYRPSRGCTCTPNDPTARRATQALARLATTDTREEAKPVTAPRHTGRARKATSWP